jgi:prepilin-type N-terminal cleavage/methylation domain-containing protein
MHDPRSDPAFAGYPASPKNASVPTYATCHGFAKRYRFWPRGKVPTQPQVVVNAGVSTGGSGGAGVALYALAPLPGPSIIARIHRYAGTISFVLRRLKMLSNKRGFTLIELLIVVVIIGILAAIAIPKFANTKEKAYLAAMKSDLRNMATYEEQYAADNGG